MNPYYIKLFNKISDEVANKEAQTALQVILETYECKLCKEAFKLQGMTGCIHGNHQQIYLNEMKEHFEKHLVDNLLTPQRNE